MIIKSATRFAFATGCLTAIAALHVAHAQMGGTAPGSYGPPPGAYGLPARWRMGPPARCVWPPARRVWPPRQVAYDSPPGAYGPPPGTYTPQSRLCSAAQAIGGRGISSQRPHLAREACLF